MLMPGVKVSRKILLSTAFMHKSWLNCGAARAKHMLMKHPKEAKEEGLHGGLFSRSAVLCRANEGLELLGDSIIKTAATEVLLRERPFDSLDSLAQQRSMLENNQILGIASLNFWISAPLLLFDAEALETSRQRIGVGGIALSRAYLKAPENRAILQQAANALEAVLGAVALEHGHAAAISFAQEQLIPSLKTLLDRHDMRLGGAGWNPIQLLQHRMHERSGVNITFRKLEQSVARDREKRGNEPAVFKVGCYTFAQNIDREDQAETLLGVGYGSSIQEARKDAAERILAKLDGKQ